jgi:hypothetical protein
MFEPWPEIRMTMLFTAAAGDAPDRAR